MSDKNIAQPEQFDWRVALKNAIEGNFEGTSIDTNIFDFAPDGPGALMVRAQEWPTCACGQLCEALPRDTSGAPKDWKLQSLGRDFHLAIMQEQWRTALSIMEQIEKRSTSLLQQMGAFNSQAIPQHAS